MLSDVMELIDKIYLSKKDKISLVQVMHTLYFLMNFKFYSNGKCRETISQTGRVDNSREIILTKTKGFTSKR